MKNISFFHFRIIIIIIYGDQLHSNKIQMFFILLVSNQMFVYDMIPI